MFVLLKASTSIKIEFSIFIIIIIYLSYNVSAKYSLVTISCDRKNVFCTIWIQPIHDMMQNICILIYRLSITQLYEFDKLVIIYYLTHQNRFRPFMTVKILTHEVRLIFCEKLEPFWYKLDEIIYWIPNYSAVLTYGIDL